jgi:hypothetical protein
MDGAFRTVWRDGPRTTPSIARRRRVPGSVRSGSVSFAAPSFALTVAGSRSRVFGTVLGLSRFIWKGRTFRISSQFGCRVHHRAAFLFCACAQLQSGLWCGCLKVWDLPPRSSRAPKCAQRAAGERSLETLLHEPLLPRIAPWATPRPSIDVCVERPLPRRHPCLRLGRARITRSLSFRPCGFAPLRRFAPLEQCGLVASRYQSWGSLRFVAASGGRHCC